MKTCSIVLTFESVDEELKVKERFRFSDSLWDSFCDPLSQIKTQHCNGSYSALIYSFFLKHTYNNF